jgi:hypothetical protein
MKWLRWTLPLTALAFASPTWAQSGDQSVQEGFRRIIAVYSECFDKQNAAGLGEVFTQDGIYSHPVAAVSSVWARMR